MQKINRKGTADPRNAKEHYQSFIRKKLHNEKNFENRNIVDITVTTEHQKASHKLFKTIREAKKVGSLYNDINKVKIS